MREELLENKTNVPNQVDIVRATIPVLMINTFNDE
jgi:hypothetical protein